MSLRNEKAKQFGRQFGYVFEDAGLDKLYEVWAENKANLLNKFRQHPNWNEDALAIVMPQTEFEKQFNNSALRDFKTWVYGVLPKFKESKASEDLNESYYINKLDDIRAMIRYSEVNDSVVTVNGKNVQDIRLEINTEYDEFMQRISELHKIKNLENDKALYIDEDFESKASKVYRAIQYIADYAVSRSLTADLAREINNYVDINAVEGQKLSRVINKLCTSIGLNEYQETETRTAENGVESQIQVGYQHHFNILGEEINPQVYKRNVVISLNPLDYWGMSLGDGWASCMVVDKFNIWRFSSNTHGGMYSGGTESYMLDESTIVFYTVSDRYEGTDYYLQPKKNRCLFMVSDDFTTMIQSRVYPDGRDGGDNNKAKQFRMIMQDVVATVGGNENRWRKQDGYSPCNRYSESTGSHYKDYLTYSDVNVSYLSSVEPTRIRIGHNAICPVCGREHTRDNNILCHDCDDNEHFNRELALTIEDNPIDETVVDEVRVERCEYCGNEGEFENRISVEGHIFCCESCANNGGYHFVEGHGWMNDDVLTLTENAGYQLSTECYEDDFTHLMYHGAPLVTTRDGHTFSCGDNARQCGWIYDSNEDYWFTRDDADVIAEDGNIFYTVDSAEISGYVKAFDGKWYRRNLLHYDSFEDVYYTNYDAEVVTDDDYFFLFESSAIRAGYRETENGWVKVEETRESA